MTTTPLFGTLAQDATLQLLIAQAVAVPQAFTMSGVGSVAQVDVTARSIVTAQVVGQSGSVTMQPQVSDDNATWTVLTNPDAIDNVGVATGAQQTTITANGTYRFDTKGFPYFRLYQSAGTGSNTTTLSASMGVLGSRLSIGGPVRVAAQAAGAADPGLQILGFRAPATPAARSAAAAYGAMMVDTEGKQVVTPHADTAQQFNYAAVIAAVSTNQSARAAGATGIRHYVTTATYSNESASPVLFQIQDGTTVLHRAMVPANSAPQYVFPTPLKGTAATALNVQAGSTSAFATITGFDGV